MKDVGTEGFMGAEVDAYFIIYDAEVLTESCSGDSMFPPEGETGNVHFMVGVGGVNIDELNVEYCSIYFR